jgi:hypothetical protein
LHNAFAYQDLVMTARLMEDLEYMGFELWFSSGVAHLVGKFPLQVLPDGVDGLG